MDKLLNIVFTLPEKASRSAVSLSGKIKTETRVNFTLHKNTNVPHITVYQLIIPDRNLNRLIKILEDLALKLPPQNFRFAGFEEHSGYLSVELSLPPRVKLFQEEVIKSVNFLREGRSLIGEEGASNYPKSQRKNIAEYGFDNLLDFYNPHITITCLSDPENAKKLISELSWTENEFFCSSIGLYSLGEFGTCKELIREFKLRAED
jgi:hypothetical protein